MSVSFRGIGLVVNSERSVQVVSIPVLSGNRWARASRGAHPLSWDVSKTLLNVLDISEDVQLPGLEVGIVKGIIAVGVNILDSDL